MTDQQALDILELLDCKGLARTARDISVDRIKAWFEVEDEIKALWTSGHKYYIQGFEAGKRACLKVINEHRKEQNW